jgi:MYXO-CTERM domain-containing protein
MLSQRSFRHALAALIASSALLAPASARASNTCAQSTDCPKGFSCQTSTVYPPCPAIACATGSDCVQPKCDPETISQCTPVPCTSTDDCAAGMVCYTQTIQDCPVQTTPACPPNVVCPPPTPEPAPSCTMTTTSSCVPKYLLPCTTASDCGDGFACVHDQVGSCSGGSGVTPSEDGGPPEVTPTDPVCMTMTLSTSHCEANTLICTSNGDCPSGWTCEAQLQAVSNVACAGPVSIDGGTTVPDCPTPTPEPVQKQCQPPYADLASTGTFGSDTSLGSGSGASAPQTAAPENPTAEKSATGPDAASDGGCTMGSGHGGNGAFSLLGIVGLAGLVFRRRRAG